jgi:imidazoleglycerol-phosphate dehydratase / histidinol-phosphatase
MITVEVNLDGSGKSSIGTGIGFFDHMLEQIARHGGIDLFISAKGDLETDEHHTIEDVGIALGEAASRGCQEARKECRGMASCSRWMTVLQQYAIDLGGRPWLVWDVTFSREKIGEMPSEMFFHFFKSFSDSAKCNLNIKAEGQNDHHKAEAIFKSFARALGEAVKNTGSNVLPSTKGKL